MLKILGLDPGLRNTGWGIISINGNNVGYIAHGTITTNSNDNIAKRLNHIHKEILGILSIYQPQEAAVEEIFVNKNPASALKLGMARGVVLFTPASFGAEVFEYSANKVKKSVVGVGHAEKSQVAAMINIILPQAPKNITADAADALAVAICHSNHRAIKKYL